MGSRIAAAAAVLAQNLGHMVAMSPENFFSKFSYATPPKGHRYALDRKHRKAVDGRRANVKRMQALKRKGRYPYPREGYTKVPLTPETRAYLNELGFTLSKKVDRRGMAAATYKSLT